MSTPARRGLLPLVATTGALVGIAAGCVQAAAGTRIPDWSGAKDDPVALGLLTMALSAVALAAAGSLRGRPRGGPAAQVGRATAFAVPGALCFSTVGRLWYAPGVLLLAAAVGSVMGLSRTGLWTVVRTYRVPSLLAFLGAAELLMAATAAPLPTMVIGLLGGGLVLTSCLADARRTRLALVAAGTVPFALLTWWSIATPMVALLALGLATHRNARPVRHHTLA